MALREWSFAFHDDSKGQYNQAETTKDGWMYVCTAGAVSPPTIYSNERGSVSLTSTSNGHGVLVNTLALVFITNGYCRFWTEASVTSLDVTYLTDSGEAGFLKGISSSYHYLPIHSAGGSHQLLAVPFLFIASTAVQDTLLDLPADLCIYDANIDVVTTDASATVDVGFINSGESGDEDGLLDGMSTTSSGLGTPAGVITNDTVVDYVSDTNGKYGALLATYIDGSAATTVAAQGGLSRKVYRTNGTIKSLVYTPSNSDTMKGFFYLWYTKLMG